MIYKQVDKIRLDNWYNAGYAMYVRYYLKLPFNYQICIFSYKVKR